jgi:hypothetical protein
VALKHVGGTAIFITDLEIDLEIMWIEGFRKVEIMHQTKGLVEPNTENAMISHNVYMEITE